MVYSWSLHKKNEIHSELQIFHFAFQIRIFEILIVNTREFRARKYQGHFITLIFQIRNGNQTPDGLRNQLLQSKSILKNFLEPL